MAKKVLVLTVLAVVIAGGAFAQIKPSAGVGGYFTSDFGGGAEESQGGGTVTIEMPYAGGGGFAFLDLTCAELSLGLWGSAATFKTKNPAITYESDYSIK